MEVPLNRLQRLKLAKDSVERARARVQAIAQQLDSLNRPPTPSELEVLRNARKHLRQNLEKLTAQTCAKDTLAGGPTKEDTP